MNSPLEYKPIGTVRSPFGELTGMPIQPVGALGVEGRIEVLPAFVEGLSDLEGFSHLILLYHFHKSAGFSLRIKPFLDDREHGVFATRAPKRPNAIGFSVLEVAGVEETAVRVRNIDVLDGTPVLDIKPYVPRFDVWPAQRIGWFEGRDENAASFRSDSTYTSSREVRTCNP